MDKELAELAEHQCDVVRRDQLRQAGMTPDQLRARLGSGRWQALGAVVIVMHNGPLNRRQQWWAGVLAAGKGAVLGGLTALEAAGLRHWTDSSVHVTVLRGSGIAQLPGVPLAVHETRIPLPARHYAPPRADVPRAAIDAASWCRGARACCGLLAAVVQQRLTTASRLSAALKEAGPVRHRRAMRLAIADIGGGAQALSEIDFAALCRKHGLGRVVGQRVRYDGKGHKRYLDGDIEGPDGKLLPYEIDGGLHMEAERFWNDLERQNELLILGSFPLRFAAFAVRFQPDKVADQVRRAFAA